MKRLILLLAILFVISCKNDPTQLRRSDLIPKNKLVSILTEMHMVDAMSNSNQVNTNFPTGDSIDIYGHIFKKYKVSPAEFDTTIARYSRRPDLFLKIYNDVIIRLNYIKDTVNNNRPKFSIE